MTAVLTCPVRGCGAPLAWEERRCACPRGHSFDRARSGYVNLLTPQDKRAKEPGDSREIVRARGRLLDGGFDDHVLEALGAILAGRGLPGGAHVLDVGCGDGFHLAALASRLPLAGWGVDISSAAVEAAAKRAPGLRWIAANADRRLPFADGSFAAILSITSRRNAGELARLLRAGGLLVVAVPGPDDLRELRAAVLGRADDRERGPAAVEALRPFFRLERRIEARVRRALDAPELRDLLATTYRGARRSAEARAAGLARMEVTSSAEILCLSIMEG